MKSEKGNHWDVYQEIIKIDAWLKRNNYEYDSINSLPQNKVIDKLITRNNSLGMLWRQFFRLSPLNIRFIFGQNPCPKNPKAMILLSLAYLELWSLTKNENFLDSFNACGNWVILQRSKNTENFAIPQLKKLFVRGYNATEDDISPFLTCWAGHLFLKAYHYLGDKIYLNLADSVGNYFIRELPRIEKDKKVYFYYVPNHAAEIRCYNCSALISAYLLKLSDANGNPLFFEYGKKGIDYLIKVQNDDGSWYYGNTKSTWYVDNFHSAFILLALHEARKYYLSDDLKSCFKLSLSYYKNRLFKTVSKDIIRPRHFDPLYLPRNSNLIQKVDLRDSALSIILFSELSKEKPECTEFTNKVLTWTITNMKGKIGYYNELTWFWPNKIPYIEFQAWIFLAFAIFLRNFIRNKNEYYE